MRGTSKNVGSNHHSTKNMVYYKNMVIKYCIIIKIG